VVSVKITVLWVVTFRNLAGSCRSFGRTCWRQLRVRKQTHLPNITTSHPRRCKCTKIWLSISQHTAKPV